MWHKGSYIELLLYRAACIFCLFAASLLFTSCAMSKITGEDTNVTQEVISRNGGTVVVKAGKIYEASKLKRFLLGDHYRDVWMAPVEVPLIDLNTAKGGLKILERGGGMQTFTLKLKGGNGRLYSLRSLQKDPSPLLPFALQLSFVDDIVQDQISASNPYGAFTLPPLGDAAGIYHTNPELIYIPDSPILGKHRKYFGGMLAMLEQDADEHWPNYEDFGFTENAVSTETVLEKLEEDNENYVDQKNYLRVRLFDMWVGDVDRHEGQFRWAELEHEQGKFYRPIPEDRDNVFFKFDGVIPWIISRKWALRKFQDFQEDIRDVPGFNFGARHIDRRFLTELPKEVWLKVAKDLQERLTDDVIKEAINILPDTVFKLTGPQIISTLKGRRANLSNFASEYYEYLAKQVDVVGSNEQEYFETIRRPGETEVNVFKASKDGQKERQLYHRVFYHDETNEVRLYGLGGEDLFYVSGKSDDGVLLRIIGGMDEDVFADSSAVEGLRRKTIYYDDSEKENKIEDGRETKLKIKPGYDNNAYNFEEFKYDYLGPTAYFGLNSDDGLFLGGGVIIKTQGFRKHPYGSYQKIAANFSPSTRAWNFNYEGDFINVLGELGMHVGLLVRAPNYFTNFYGFGNETVATVDDDDFYRARFIDVQFFPGLRLRAGEKSTVKFGPSYEYAKVEEDPERYLSALTPTMHGNVFAPSHFAGFKFDAIVNTTGQENKPEKGIRWFSEIEWLAELNNDHSKLSRFKSEFSVYYTVDIPFETTFAARIGGSTISGEFNFYQASTIGGNAGFSRLGTLRGYGRDRFAGRSSLYQNNEIRMRLLKVPFYYMPFEMGISAHFDHGRVWVDDENSDEWHTGTGGGLWIAPIGRWVFTAVYTKGEEEGIYNINLGFLF